VSGFVLTFFPYIKGWEGNISRNPHIEWKKVSGHFAGVTPSHFLPSISKAPFTWHYLQDDFPMEFIGGFTVTTQNEKMEIIPELSWIIVESGDKQ